MNLIRLYQFNLNARARTHGSKLKNAKYGEKKCQTGNKNYYSNEYLLPTEPLFRTSTSEKYHDTFFIVTRFFLSFSFLFILSFVTSSLPSHYIFHNFIFHHHHSIIILFSLLSDPIFHFTLAFVRRGQCQHIIHCLPLIRWLYLGKFFSTWARLWL